MTNRQISKQFSPEFLLIFILFGSSQCHSDIVRHGESLKFQNVGDQMFLTSTEHSIRPEYGVYAGPVFTETEFEGAPNQVWDTIRWPNTPENQFWLYPKGATLNEVTAQHVNGFPIPEKNLVEFVYILQNEKNTGEFLIKSVLLNKCVTSHGTHVRITYEPCKESNSTQLWRGESASAGDVKLRHNKTKFSCKFYREFHKYGIEESEVEKVTPDSFLPLPANI